MLDQAKKDHELLVAIQQVMSGVEWSPDTLDIIAQLLNSAGYTIHEPRRRR
jgi:hypothetical protein